MTKTMAEVLAEHRSWATTNPDGEWLVICSECKSALGTYDEIVPTEADRSGGSYDYMDEAHAAHQAAALSAAGFGLVADAGAKALREAAEASFDGLHSEPVHEWLYARARAAAVRGEG